MPLGRHLYRRKKVQEGKAAMNEEAAAASLDGAGLGDSTERESPRRLPLNLNLNQDLDKSVGPDPIAKRHKPSSSYSYLCKCSGKENILPKPTCQGVGGFSAAFRRTLSSSFYPCDQTQTTEPVQITGAGNQSCLSSSSSVIDLDSGISLPQISRTSPSWPQNHRNPCPADLISFQSHSIESRLLSSSIRHGPGSGQDSGDTGVVDNDDADGLDLDFEPDTQFGAFMRLCSDEDTFIPHDPDPALVCPLCGLDISQFNQDSRQLHVNACLDNSEPQREIPPTDAKKQLLPSQSAHKPCVQYSAQVAGVAPVVEWLHRLGLGKYEAAFIQQEIDWDSLRFLTEEDIIAIGVTALGPRKKILQSLKELRERDNILIDQEDDGSAHTMDAAKKLHMNRLITEFFSCPISDGNKNLTSSRQQQLGKTQQLSCQGRVPVKNMLDGKRKDVPSWCSVPGTPFRVDAFQYLRRDCSHWFLTHFHIDHYQGLTRSFSYGKIYCSIITAKLVNAKIGISWDRLHVMPLDQKMNIAGIGVTCFDANHCPGSIIILFEPPNGKAVLHTGDFRFNEEMTRITALQACHIHTLILDTTYCNPQYNFPKQEIVLQFVIEAIQAESFNPKTLFLIGSYTIGKERLFLEVARVLHKKIYVSTAKLRLLECLELPPEDMRWFTLNELESHIHVVPMWSIASFKRLKQLSYQYAERFSLIVAFTPTGWTFGKGKKSAGAGRRWQQGTIIRYEVPYSEHCSFEELKEFVKFISPVNIIPSVNNEGEVSTKGMTTLLMS